MDGVEIGNLQIPAIKGEKGDAGKIVGLTITMLESTATPSVTNIGTEYEANYVLGIPRGTGIASVVKNDSGELVITLTDGTTINLGSIEPISITNVEIDAEYNLIVTLSDSTEINAGNLEEELSTIMESYLSDYYTKAEMGNALMNAQIRGSGIDFTRKNGSNILLDLRFILQYYQLLIDAENKVNADYVDDTSSTNKFVTSAEKTTWNNKSDFSGSYNDLTNKPNLSVYETTSNKSTTITSSSTDTQYASAKAVYTYVTSVVGDINSVLDDINRRNYIRGY